MAKQSKQDKQGVRTAQALEQKYAFDKTFEEAQTRLKVATTKAEQAVQQALKAYSEILQLSDSISLTVDNGESTAQIKLKVGDREIPATIDMKGLVTFSNLANADGTTVINGSNITTGQILADLIKAGTIKSKDGESVVIDLDKGEGTFTGSFKTKTEFMDEDAETIECYALMNSYRVDVVRDAPLSHEEASISPKFFALTRMGGATSMLSSGELDIYDGDQRAKIQITDNDANMILSADHLEDSRTDLNFSVSPGKAKITGLTAPEGASDAVNKGYVDNYKPANATNADYATNAGAVNGYDTLHAYGWWTSGSGQHVNSLTDGYAFVYSGHGAPTTGPIISFGNNGYHTQIQSYYSGHELWYRNLNGDNGSWTSWYHLIDSGNIGSQTVHESNWTNGCMVTVGTVVIPTYSTTGSNGYNYYGDVSVSAIYPNKLSGTSVWMFLQTGYPGTTGVIALEPISWDHSGLYSLRIHRSSSASNIPGFNAYYLAVSR